MKTFTKILGAATAALIIGLLPANAADTAKGGGKKLIELTTPSQVAKLEKGDIVITACPKCKTVVHTRVKATAKGGGSATEQVASHGCPGCGAKVELSGHGKGKVDRISHACSHCGSAEAFCSILKKKDAE